MLGSRLSTMAMVLASFLASTSDLVDCCCHNLLGRRLSGCPPPYWFILTSVAYCVLDMQSTALSPTLSEPLSILLMKSFYLAKWLDSARQCHLSTIHGTVQASLQV